MTEPGGTAQPQSDGGAEEPIPFTSRYPSFDHAPHECRSRRANGIAALALVIAILVVVVVLAVAG